MNLTKRVRFGDEKNIQTQKSDLLDITAERAT